MNSLEDYLSQFSTYHTLTEIKEKRSTREKADNKKEYELTAKEMLRAEKGASFDNFIEMVSKLVCLTMEEDNVEFLPDENQHVIIDPDIKIDKTYITYRLISRSPEREIKPMAREEIIEPGIDDSNERRGIVYGQRYDCLVQFNVFASEYKTANKVMKNFEEMIFSFTGYMKSKGVQNILFKGQSTDTDFNVYRKTMSVRSLKYEVKIEDLIVIFSDKIQSIISKGAL